MNRDSSKGGQFVLIVGGCSCVILAVGFAFGPMAESWHYGPGAPIAMLFSAFCYFALAFKGHEKNSDRAVVVIAIAALISAITAMVSFFSRQ